MSIYYLMEEKNNQPGALISVVIPTFNQKPKFLSECIESVINQAYDNIEIIIADNHSTNGTDIMIAAYASRDKRIRLVMPDKHLTLAENFAFAATHVKTPYLSFLSSDDWVYPDWLSNMMPGVINNDVVWAYGEIEATDITLKKINYVYRKMLLPTGVYPARESFNRFITLVECGWMVGDIIKTSTYFDVGGIIHKDITYCSDFALAFKLHEKGNVYYLNTIVAKNRQWFLQDGKVDSNRSVKEIADFAYIYEIAEKSKILNSFLPQGQTTIEQWRKYYSIVFAKILIIDFAEKRTDKADRDLAAKNIMQLHSSLAVRIYLMISRNQYLCSWFYSIYKRIKK